MSATTEVIARNQSTIAHTAEILNFSRQSQTWERTKWNLFVFKLVRLRGPVGPRAGGK